MASREFNSVVNQLIWATSVSRTLFLRMCVCVCVHGTRHMTFVLTTYIACVILQMGAIQPQGAVAEVHTIIVQQLKKGKLLKHIILIFL